MPIYDAAMKYRDEGVPLVVLAGAEYGTGSSRDWAAKGTYLLGVRAVIAASFERIHRSNLVGMGVLPLEFPAGRDLAVAGPDRRRDVRHRRLGRQPAAAQRRLTRRAPRPPTADQEFAAKRPHRHAGRDWTTTATAASCRPCCASCWRSDLGWSEIGRSGPTALTMRTTKQGELFSPKPEVRADRLET